MDVQFIVPDSIDDPGRPSGGNFYDRRLSTELIRLGWRVQERELMDPDQLGPLLVAQPDGELIMIDGLISNGQDLASAGRRLRLVTLVHLPLGVESASARPDEATVLAACTRVIVASRWTRGWLLTHYPLEPQQIVVAEPGTDPAPLAVARATGGRLVCVAVVAKHKGQDVLIEALNRLSDSDWRCRLVGSLDRDRAFVADLQATGNPGLARVEFAGALDAAAVAEAYAETDLLVLPSRAETYGMVVTEALARGIPVIASDVGGVPDALGRDDSGGRPGILVPPGDPMALASALRNWLDDAELRARLRHSARQRRLQLSGWTDTARRVSDALNQAQASSVFPSEEACRC